MYYVDVVLMLNSLVLEDNESVDDVVDYLAERFSFGYEPTVDILYIENLDEYLGE